jgi:UDP-N-acetylmuramate--alanine ligase
MLAELMRVKYGVAIAGSHGKTTTTSLVATILSAAGYDPTVVVGGRMAALGSNARLGEGDLLVAEADESDGSFLRLTPTIAVVTNIDPEHLDHYGTHENLKEAFVQFVEKVPFYGLAVLCLDHPDVQLMLPRVQRRHVTYGLSPQADYSARQVEYEGTSVRFSAFRRGEALGQFSLRMPGIHNVLNALAAIAVGDELAVPMDVLKESLAQFPGVARRFTVIGELDGVALVDDYGHHPAEIRATLTAARRAYNGRVIAVFQPHRYSRTQSLFEEFTRSFNDCDELLMVPIYPAGEAPIAGITAEKLADAVITHGHHNVRYFDNLNVVAETLARDLKRGDVIVALGAGDVNKVLRLIQQQVAVRSIALETPQ